MRNSFFANVQAVFSKLSATAGSNDRPAIQKLKKEEYSAVAGGPQIINEPQQ